MTYDEFKDKYASKMPKKRKAMQHPEDELQKECVRWFKEEAYPDLAPLLFHPNNEPYFGAGKTADQKARAGARAKAMGVTAGVADLILMHPGATFTYGRYDDFPEPIKPVHALCIEMKTKVGRQSDSQKQWQQSVQGLGYRYEVVRTVEQFKELVREHIGIPPRDPEQAAISNIFGPEFKARIHKK